MGRRVVFGLVLTNSESDQRQEVPLTVGGLWIQIIQVPAPDPVFNYMAESQKVPSLRFT